MSHYNPADVARRASMAMRAYERSLAGLGPYETVSPTSFRAQAHAWFVR